MGAPQQPVRQRSELCRSFVTFVGLTGDLNSFTHAPAVHHSDSLLFLTAFVRGIGITYRYHTLRLHCLRRRCIAAWAVRVPRTAGQWAGGAPPASSLHPSAPIVPVGASGRVTVGGAAPGHCTGSRVHVAGHTNAEGMGLRAPLYMRRCLGRRRCAIPCALCVLAAYGIYSKIVPVPEAVRTEVPPPLNSHKSPVLV